MSRSSTLSAELARGSAPQVALFAGRLRELLELLGALRELDGPLTTPEGLRGALAVLERLAILLGADEEWLAWLRRLAADESLLHIAASIVEYWWSRRAAAPGGMPGTWNRQAVEALDVKDWLPLLLELIELLRALRGAN